jgi:hypothetical protein
MNDLIVSEATFYRKNPEQLAGAAMGSGGVAPAVRWASRPLRRQCLRHTICAGTNQNFRSEGN